MAYSDFSLKDAVRLLHLVIQEQAGLFAEIPEHPIGAHLQETLRANVPLALAISTEKARSELIIAPVLVELRKVLEYRISLFSGVEFNVDQEKGLVGVCDFILSLSSEQLFVRNPVIAIVEAKNENIKAGLGQCIAEMQAARLFNEREGNAVQVVYGVVTTGSIWRFSKLSQDTVQIDLDEYYIDSVDRIMGVLVGMIRGNA